MNNLPTMFWGSPTQERVSDEEVKAEPWTCDRHLTPVEQIPVGEMCPVCQLFEEKQ